MMSCMGAMILLFSLIVKYGTSKLLYFITDIKGSLLTFFIGLSDINWTEKESLIGGFLLEVLTFSVQILSYLGASDRPIKKSSPFKENILLCC